MTLHYWLPINSIAYTLCLTIGLLTCSTFLYKTYGRCFEIVYVFQVIVVFRKQKELLKTYTLHSVKVNKFSYIVLYKRTFIVQIKQAFVYNNEKNGVILIVFDILKSMCVVVIQYQTEQCTHSLCAAS